jgi:hypothetical protein
MYKAIFLSPMIPSYNVGETKQFFVDIFDFKILMEGDYAIVQKDDHLIHILRAGKDIGESEFYLEVDDIDGLWDSVRNRLDNIKVKPLFDRDYGMREFHIVIPHTNTLMFVGQPLARRK